MIQDYLDMDTNNIAYVSDCSEAGSSGYATMSPLAAGAISASQMAAGGRSPALSTYSSSTQSPVPSPATVLQADFSNLLLPSNSSSPTSPYQQQQQQQHPPPQQLQYEANAYAFMTDKNYMNLNGSNVFGDQYENRRTAPKANAAAYPAELHILEQPVEKFRFRYKSEMHGTHGSLNGANSKRSPKTFPEVELKNYTGKAFILCSLFQANLQSPHSHQLVVRKDDVDICDPHKLEVSPERGYVAQFQNMGIIHTAKKFIYDELWKKKRDRLRFELGRTELSTKQMQELKKETEKEAKEMNLNQVRLCFEAFKVEEDSNTWTRIAAPKYTNCINNRKSAQTGELRICRLSIATGSVTGGDDLILLVEKVSKKNIKVLFYEHNEDEEIIWEAVAKFRESDVHHQYAISCQTPPYRDKDIDKPVEVFIELVRPSDDERSAAVTFRYKPREAVVSRKRRRTCSTATTISSEQSPMSSMEVPKTVQDQLGELHNIGSVPVGSAAGGLERYGGIRLSEEFNRSSVLQGLVPSNDDLMTLYSINSADLNLNFDIPLSEGRLDIDGPTSTPQPELSQASTGKFSGYSALLGTINVTDNVHLEKIFRIYDGVRQKNDLSESQFAQFGQTVRTLYLHHAESNCENGGDTIMHEIVAMDNAKLAMKTSVILNTFELTDVLNHPLNLAGESPMHTACLHNRPQYIRPLLRLGCDPNIQDNRGNTALHVAVREHHSNCIESFMQCNDDETAPSMQLNLCLKNDEGLTALHMAIRSRNYEVVQRLLGKHRKAALVPSGKDGNNALHMVVLQQHLPLVKCILSDSSYCCDLLRARNTAGFTAFELSKTYTNHGRDNEVMLYILQRAKEFDAADLLTIKQEEDVSSTSTEDDDEHIERMRRQIDEDPIEIKKELPDDMERSSHRITRDDAKPTIKVECCEDEGNVDGEDDDSCNVNTKNLEIILNDTLKFKKLCARLHDETKWKSLAKKAKMQHLHFLWSSAEDMLGYIKKKASSIEYQVFATALAEIDKEALQILQQT